MNELQLKAICDPTRLKILSLLAEEPMTNTELYEKLKRHKIISFRDAAFKSLKKLREAGLIERKYIDGKGFKYSLTFNELEIKPKLKIIVK